MEQFGLLVAVKHDRRICETKRALILLACGLHYSPGTTRTWGSLNLSSSALAMSLLRVSCSLRSVLFCLSALQIGRTGLQSMALQGLLLCARDFKARMPPCWAQGHLLHQAVSASRSVLCTGVLPGDEDCLPTFKACSNTTASSIDHLFTYEHCHPFLPSCTAGTSQCNCDCHPVLSSLTLPIEFPAVPPPSSPFSKCHWQPSLQPTCAQALLTSFAPSA